MIDWLDLIQLVIASWVILIAIYAYGESDLNGWELFKHVVAETLLLLPRAACVGVGLYLILLLIEA